MMFIEQKLNLLLLLLFLIFKISNNNEITIKIKGNGNQKILSDDYENEFPNEIIINGYNESYKNNVIYFDEELNTIILKWNEIQLNSSSKMFKDLENIT